MNPPLDIVVTKIVEETTDPAICRTVVRERGTNTISLMPKLQDTATESSISDCSSAGTKSYPSDSSSNGLKPPLPLPPSSAASSAHSSASSSAATLPPSSAPFSSDFPGIFSSDGTAFTSA